MSRIVLDLTPQARAKLAELVSRGTYGRDLAEAAERIVCQRLEAFVERPVLTLPDDRPAPAPPFLEPAVAAMRGKVRKAIQAAVGDLAERVASDLDDKGLSHGAWYRAVSRARAVLGGKKPRQIQITERVADALLRHPVNRRRPDAPTYDHGPRDSKATPCKICKRQQRARSRAER